MINEYYTRDFDMKPFWLKSSNFCLYRCLEERSDCCIIDPFGNIDPVLDRFKIQSLLLGLEKLNTEGRNIIRAPRCIKVFCWSFYLCFLFKEKVLTKSARGLVTWLVISFLILISGHWSNICVF